MHQRAPEPQRGLLFKEQGLHVPGKLKAPAPAHVAVVVKVLKVIETPKQQEVAWVDHFETVAWLQAHCNFRGCDRRPTDMPADVIQATFIREAKQHNVIADLKGVRRASNTEGYTPSITEGSAMVAVAREPVPSEDTTALCQQGVGGLSSLETKASLPMGRNRQGCALPP